jgi:hypothetical protein
LEAPALAPVAEPEPDRHGELTPPCSPITLAVKLTVMYATQWYYELITDPATKVMRVGRRSAAHQAWLPGEQANRFA